MDASFQNLGFAANLSLNAFKNLGKSIQVGVGDDYCMDTVLRLDSPGSSIPLKSAPKGIKRKWSLIDGSKGQQVESSLRLKLGHSSSSSDSKGSSATACTTVSSAKETDEESSMDLDLDFSLHLGNEKISIPKKHASSNLKAPDMQPEVDLQLSLSTGPTESDITSVHLSSTPSQSVAEMPLVTGGVLHMDEGLSSLRWKTGNSFHPLPTPKKAGTSLFLNQAVREIHPAPIVPDLSSSRVTTKSSVTCTSGITQQQPQQSRSTNTKICQFKGCGKGARGASGLCIAHGGGRRCQKHGCHKGAEGRTVYCKAHGGGRRCEFLGCTKSAEGRTDFCIAHGGGRRCSHEGCTRAARGKSGLCIRHGGGKRCQKENCTKSAEGLSGLCISHGGGRRCQYLACNKGAQGSTMFCKAHGGGKRCTFEGCTKGAEGSTPFCKGHGGGKRCSFQGGGVCPKSVHGGTLFCVAHGGGKRCAVPECTKSARGRTDFCVRHGGGKRCKFEGCGKSAQGSTDFCKAHGGGKRCIWGQPGSEFGLGDGPCNSFSRGKTGLCTSHGALVQDKRVHGGATLVAMVHDPKPSRPEKMKEVVVNAEDMHVDISKMDSGGVTFPGPAHFNWKQLGHEQTRRPVVVGSLSATPVLVPEGRVHGGSLMAMLTGSSGLGFNGSKSVGSGPSEPEKSNMMPHNWM
ncbi:putative WRKY transcription factor 19 [Camellia lanceoleosa]|uniref:WRKY transcription factor 19 n=1 Tax=Camellia lanceoleosa TaxID=1840588 RepID=A0ACC0FK27_9ERIC|nr:putative WRKY transcription factor 19 [Camellia lanceoleosa]